ncbi:uncharacterized protein LOC114311708 isoform X4 [Camellia sinensis]|uniref:uncharacterized protein LOC114311708 isoform X4 n=1 Tax=Camellia sinensis TaxID=4442 RepID=UPI0010365D98|nr:uncharacterized protein LOC114311708 isoform X4 [Camellia sinensis]
MELQVYNADKNLPAIGEESQVGFDEQLQELIRRGLDFDTWTSIISKIEKTYPDNIEKICSVYDSFLSEYPLCHGYWRKYAAHKAHLCTVDKVGEIFERAVQSATYCVGIWVEYCSFSMSAYEDPSDVRRLFKRAMSFVGKDYLCYPLWDKYIEFESSQQQWIFLAKIYVQTLKFPTKRLCRYYDNFKKFVAILEEEMKQHNNCIDMESEAAPDDAVSMLEDEVSCVINNLLDPLTGFFRYKALQKYISIGEQFYQEACEVERKIHCFETNIQRPYFHVMALDENQLENWHCYLDFVEMQEDFDWAVKLYERCLIPCAVYPEFWMRYVEFMETKGGRELANFALDRATKIFLKNVPAIHLFNARFKEQIGDRDGAHGAFLWSDNKFSSYFIEKVVKEANMEKRLGNFAAASNVYEKALEMAAEKQKLQSVPILYIHFARLKYMFVDQCGTVHDIRKAWNRHIKLFPHLVRTSSLDKLPTSGNQLLDMFMEAKQRSPFPLSDQPSGGHNSDNHTELQMQELTDHFQPEDKDNSAQERLQQLSPKIAEQSVEDDASGVNKLTHDSVHQSGDDTSGHMESTPYLVHQSREDAYGPVESTHNLGHKSGEDANIPMESTHGLAHQPGEDASGPIVPTQECSDSINVQQQEEQKQSHEPEQHLKLLSLDSLSLNSQEKEYGDSTLISSYKHQALISNRISVNRRNANGSPSVVSRGSNRSADSAQIQKESVNPSSLASRQNLLPEQAQTQPHVPTDDAVNWHQSNSNTVQASGDARSGFHGDSQEQQNQQWQVPPQQQIQSQVQQAIQSQNQQGFVSVHQSQPSSSLAASRHQVQVPQFSMQSGGQFGHAPYNEAAYNQIMENYFRQQQLIVQQHYEQQQQFMQQLQQQVQQQPHQQQQQEAYVQKQQQLAQLYYQQCPQLHEQQAQLMQQQLLHAQQQQDQLYHQYMQLQQQHPMQQQQGYQQLQQHHQLQQQQGQPSQQQITSTQIPTWNRSYYQEGQQVIPLHGASSSGTTESPHPQQQSQGITPAHRADGSGTSVSPHRQQQSPHGATPPHSAGASGPTTSPCNHQ